MIKSKKAIAAIFRQLADKIEAGTCEVDDEELTEIANSFVHRKLNAEQMCHHLGVSRATLTRMVADGRVPYPMKTLGGDKYWWQDVVDDHIRGYNAKYGL
ncbi:MAG: excisionase [crAssphage sp. isolate ctcc615]|uniref:Excisionase n=1 Tax=crAssphage sp. isolate ctcc615 TaxID=2989853 RepID=A0A345BNY6_9CAUD|nr:MAG: excisionase [crAssphage sp. isolate ctcc615]AXF52157.1 MAG: excisionase [crAssphage sp. isolate ctcc615]